MGKMRAKSKLGKSNRALVGQPEELSRHLESSVKKNHEIIFEARDDLANRSQLCDFCKVDTVAIYRFAPVAENPGFQLD